MGCPIKINLAKGSAMKIDFDKIKSDGAKSTTDKLGKCKFGYEANCTLMEAMKNVDNEVEVTVCYPGYGSVFTAKLKSETSVGPFAQSAFNTFINLMYARKYIEKHAENPIKEWCAGYVPNDDSDNDAATL